MRERRLEGTLYTDTALHQERKRKLVICVVMDNTGSIVTAYTVVTKYAQIIQEAAIAISMATGKAKAIFSDSKIAILNYLRGYVSTTTYNIIRDIKQDVQAKTVLLWTPADSGIPGKEVAHEAS
ncbi:hypothetical protein HPB48_001288 [Haemaphysalis longicornis]|uniref:Uncharacterized protein n=1 Tax=Haemaphysalis longicornis TaxID=44386 RepID=A0A9J6FNB3_HAELO|nr:hypothetical protein HPB48_001288 [Haemaphysalis longicornis]